MSMPHKISTLLYGFDAEGRVLLMERAQEPNLGLWSPPGGKLHTAEGESPHMCARREAREELGLNLAVDELRLAGIVSEHGYAGQAHWLMFLFEILRPLTQLPPPIREGRFAFIHPSQLEELPLPETDREQIWPLFWRHRGGFFAAHCHIQPDGRRDWTLEESRPVACPNPTP